MDHLTILHAKTLLKSSSLSIKEISNELHFEETSVFCRYFKRAVGISPKTYRNE
ncbi:helix-turn-helix domain-containing protein [Sphingobacterium sp. IITKGP-BTPF85]|uniref:helix-turn-helix domain-containing protein n=1 Tax=Sphingobacterium sp. IITKGP-BTPF85 TaxID=1338009 RepID=UPI00397CF58B